MRTAILRMAAVLASVIVVSNALAQQQPLLMEGKTTLYQKVLTRPGAVLSGAPGSGAPGKPLPAFTVLYVYQRVPITAGETYLAVGPDARGTVWGFVNEERTQEWEHSLVMLFSERAGREQVLFFRDRKSLKDMLQHPSLNAWANKVRKRANAGEPLDDDNPVVAMEPREYVDFTNREQFYMLPIMQATKIRLSGRKRAQAVEIASITRREETDTAVFSQTRPATPSSARQELMSQTGISISRVPAGEVLPGAGAPLSQFRVGVVFVIDASSSMQPYIDQAQTVVLEVARQLVDAQLEDDVRFGVVGYRDDPNKVQGIEYLAQTFTNPNDTRFTFPTASHVSTRAFAEDAFAGIDHALREIIWDNFDGRFLVLITDASARGSASPYTTMRMNAAEMRNYVHGANPGLPTALLVLHLKTPEGRKDHGTAAAQYTQLSQLDTGRSLYFPVGLGDRLAFRDAVAAFSNSLVGHMHQLRGGDPHDRPLVAIRQPVPDGENLADTVGIEASVSEVGRAMMLAYLGRSAERQAPVIYRAWASDSDFDNPVEKVFSVRLLLSKSQLSDLEKTMREVIEKLNVAQTDPQRFFEVLKSASVAMSRDPVMVGQGAARNLAGSGLMGEYLDGLPDRTRLMTMTADDWRGMGVTEQQAMIDDARSKVELYQRYHDDQHRWIPLHADAHPDDHVYPVPLDALP